MQYTSLEALRRWGNVKEFKDDLLLEATISAASRIIDAYCGRVFASAAESVHTFTLRSFTGAGYYNPFDGPTLLLDDDLAQAASAITGSPTVSYLTPNHPPFWGIVNEAGAWSSPINVTGHWAYSVSPPADIEIACLRLSKWLYEARESSRMSEVVVVTDEGKVIKPPALPDDVMTILGPYKKMRLAH